MKDVIHEIFSLTFTQAIIVYVLGLAAFILPEVLQGMGVILGTFKSNWVSIPGALLLGGGTAAVFF